MANKFITNLKNAGADITPSMREMAFCMDNLMPAIYAAGGVIPVAGLAIGTTCPSEDGKLPILYLPAGVMTAPVLVLSMSIVMQGASVLFLATFTPPPLPAVLALWAVTPVGALALVPDPMTGQVNKSALLFMNAASQYIVDAFTGGNGNEEDAPPPPPPPGTVFLPPAMDQGATVMFGYHNNTDDGYTDMNPNELSFYPFVHPREWSYSDNAKAAILAGISKPQPREVLIYIWQFDDPTGGPTNLGTFALTAYGPYSFPEDPNYQPGYTDNVKRGAEAFRFGPSTSFDVRFEFPYDGFPNGFDVTLTVCNAGGSLTGTRTAIYTF